MLSIWSSIRVRKPNAAEKLACMTTREISVLKLNSASGIATPGGTTEAGLKVLSNYDINKVITETLLATASESKKTK